MSSNPAISTVGLTSIIKNAPVDSFLLADRVNANRLLSRDATTPSSLDLCTAISPVVGVSLVPGEPSSTDGHPDTIGVKLIDSPGYFTVYTAETSVAVGDYLWQAADGTVSATPSNGELFEAASALSAAGNVTVKRIEKTRTSVHTVTAGEGTANSATITTGWGTNVHVVSVTVDTLATEAGLTAGDGTTDGDVDVAATSLTAGETIVLVTTPAATN